MLAREREHPAVDLAHLLASGRVLRRQRSRERARTAAHVQDRPRVSDAEHNSHPSQVVELQMTRVREIDVGRIHVALAQEPPRRAQRIALSHEIAAASQGLRRCAHSGHCGQGATLSRALLIVGAAQAFRYLVHVGAVLA